MIDQVGAETGSVAFNPPGASPPRSPHQGPADASSDLKFFGNDGFTFLDFLDVINPLQHIPVVSALYRSITGDSIDPGAKIAGGTLFGGPLGAALSGLDVAVKHSTGLDITDHAVAFFTGTKNDQNTPAPAKTGLETASLEPAKMGNRSLEIQSSDPALRPIEAGLMPLTGDPLKPPLLKTQTGEGRFQSAGMFAIPIAKRPSGAESQGAAITLKSLPDLGMLGDITQLTAPNGQLGSKKDTSGLTLFPQGLNNKVSKANQIPLTSIEPYLLTPKFSVTGILPAASGDRQSKPVSLPPPASISTQNSQPDNPIKVTTQKMSATKNSWIVDAMRQGLDKYKSAKSLATDPSHTPAVSVRR